MDDDLLKQLADYSGRPEEETAVMDEEIPVEDPINGKIAGLWAKLRCLVGVHNWRTTAVSPSAKHGQVLGVKWHNVTVSQHCRCTAVRDITRTRWTSIV